MSYIMALFARTCKSLFIGLSDSGRVNMYERAQLMFEGDSAYVPLMIRLPHLGLYGDNWIIQVLFQAKAALVNPRMT